jgi:hypothetical protein
MKINAFSISTIALISTAFSAFAENTFEKDRKAILRMAGSYGVVFSFQESFPIQKGYELKKPYREEAREYVKVLSDTGERIVLQHLLVVGDKDEEQIIKHWGQIWTYEDDKILNYEGGEKWSNVELAKDAQAGKWAQLVTQTDDTPRYEAAGYWLHTNEASEWVSETTRRPLPRRDAEKRDDYDVLVVQNRHIVTLQGWCHFQHNLKRNESGKAPFDLCMEVGLNTYTKLPDGELALAEKWWVDNQKLWMPVNQAWVEAIDRASSIDLEKQVEGKSYTKHFKEILRAWKKSGAPDAQSISVLLGKFITK